MNAQQKAREKADAERLLARLRCWLIRARLIKNGIEEIGVNLSHGMITVTGAYNCLADLAIDADELAAALAEGEEVLPDSLQGDLHAQHVGRQTQNADAQNCAPGLAEAS